MKNLSIQGARVIACVSDEVCEVVQCEVCLKEVPASVAQNFEGADYLHHFCGLDCLGLWRENIRIDELGIRRR